MKTSSPEKPSGEYIRDMFGHFANRYEIFTFLIGLGQDQRLRRHTLKTLKKGMRVLDLACGTGDLALLASQKIGDDGEVVGLDFSPQMLEKARRRAQKRGLGKNGNLSWVLKKAEDLPLGDQRFDLVVSGYALRNLYENIDAILEKVRHSLAPEGQIAFLDLTEPADPFRRALFQFYLFVFVGIYGTLLFGKNYPIPYLPESASRFLKSHEFTEKLRKAGFENVHQTSFMLGAVTLYQARWAK